MMDLAGRPIHFMGIGGAGMSALAGLALARGARVSGCDREESGRTRWLRQRGVPVALGHGAAHAEGVDGLVCTSAVPPDHPERLAAGPLALGRGAFLARLMEGRRAAGVAGTHGKTTTTLLVAQMARALDPEVAAGGVSEALEGGNHRAGGGGPGSVFIAELDESDGSFLLPALEVALVGNMEAEHLAHYGSEREMRAAFRAFAGRLAPGATLVLGGDDPGALSLREAAPEGVRVVTAGLAEGCDWRVVSRLPGAGVQAQRLRLRCPAGAPGAAEGAEMEAELPLPGPHNAKNAVMALAAAAALGVGVPEALRALAGARGAERRLQRLGRLGGAALYSDYAHHPTEVRASIAGLREAHGGPLLVVFQPHLYSRTRDCAQGLAQALSGADAVVLVDLYPAREEPLPGVDAGLVARQVGLAPGGRSGPADGPLPVGGVEAYVRARAQGFAAVALMGAGDIAKAADALASSPA